MNISQLCQKYQVYCADDITPAWQKYVNDVEDFNTWDHNAAMLEFLRQYYSTRAKKESTYLADEEKALDFFVMQINDLLKRNGNHLEVSAEKKTRHKAAVAACGKLGWHLFSDCPTDIYISETDKGRFLCEIRSTIYYSEKAGELAMNLVDNDRFTTPWLAIGYAAKCKNLNAYYRIGMRLADLDPNKVRSALSDIQSFPFPNQSLTVKNWGGNAAPLKYTLTPNMPVYWFYLGAEAGGINCTYRAATIFRNQKIYPMYAKYIHSLTTYDNDYRTQAEMETLELLATQKNSEDAIGKPQKNRLLTHLVDKYSANASPKLSQQALRLLADHAYAQKKYRLSLNYYERAGIKSPKDTTDNALIDRMGTMLYDLGDKQAALEWLSKTYTRYMFAPSLAGGVAAKIGDIYLQRWKSTKSAQDAQTAANYLKLCSPKPQEMAELLRMHTEDVIKLDSSVLRKYAQGSVDILDARTAGKLGYKLWESDKKSEAELPVALMRRAIDQDKANGQYWYNLGMMVGYNTLYGEGFSAQKLEMAMQYFETAQRRGYVWAALQLSDCYWSPQKDEFPQDYQKARELLQGLCTHGNPEVRHRAYMRLSSIGKQEKLAIDEVISYLAKAHQAKSKGNAAGRFHKFYGQWLGGYVEQIRSEGNLQQEIEQLFCGNADFIYAVAMQQEMAGNYRCAIALYGCSAAMGSKKALCNLYNMAKPGTDYFAQKEATA